VDKAQIYQSFLNEMTNVYNDAVKAAEDAHATATHTESTAENKYDTFGLESAYLAHGQSQRVLQYQSDLLSLNNLNLPNLDASSSIIQGALVVIEDQNQVEKIVLLGPVAGGLTVSIEGKNISMVSISSPLGQKLLGSFEGDSIAVAIGSDLKVYDIVAVS